MRRQKPARHGAQGVEVHVLNTVQAYAPITCREKVEAIEKLPY